VLVVEDEPTSRMLIERWLERDGYRVEGAGSAEEALEVLGRVVPDVICLDIELPGMSGLEALELVMREHPRLPVIILTADREVETVVTAMQRGAHDYLPKPVDRTKLSTTVRNATELYRLKLRVSSLERAASGASYKGIVGEAPSMQALFRELERVAPTDVSVLIHGESGTGKELVARAIHDASPRAEGPFVALNCAAVPESLQESEFFGHEKGAFTGALARRLGRFELAHGGTLFLDEVGELSASLQAKLLRVLQERTFQRVGGTQDVRSDFRLVTATHRDIGAEADAGRFRSDLYFRLAVFELELPALRARPGDVELLARHFLKVASPSRPLKIDPEAMAALEAYPWPGNVRELENAIQRATVVCREGMITLGDLPPRVREPHAPPPSAASSRMRPSSTPPSTRASVSLGPSRAPSAKPPQPARMDEVERQALERALAQTKGNVSEAVRILGIGRTTAYRLMKKYGIRA
jgi:DNA-binding NtrC family response regulator